MGEYSAHSQHGVQGERGPDQPLVPQPRAQQKGRGVQGTSCTHHDLRLHVQAPADAQRSNSADELLCCAEKMGIIHQVTLSTGKEQDTSAYTIATHIQPYNIEFKPT